MIRLDRWASLLVLAVWAACGGCSQSGPSNIIAKANRVHDVQKELVAALESVRDADSATAAIPRIQAGFTNAGQALKDYQRSEDAVNARGGVTDRVKKQVEEKMDAVGALGDRMGQEIERIKQLPGIPLEFHNTLRVAAVRYVLAAAEVAGGQFSSDAVSYFRGADKLFTQFGPQRVVAMDVTQMSSTSANQLAARLRTMVGAGGDVYFVQDGLDASFMAGPVDDFNEFCAAIDFGDIISRDEAQLTIEVDARRATIGTSAPLPGAGGGGRGCGRALAVGADALRLHPLELHQGAVVRPRVRVDRTFLVMLCCRTA
jgi:hypothetical protein